MLMEASPEVTAHVFVYRNGESVASTSVQAKTDLQVKWSLPASLDYNH